MKHLLLLATALLMTTLASLGAAELSVASLFSDHAILQRDRLAPVWGRADPGEEVTVEFAGQKKTTTADAGGDWLVKLDAMSASAEPRALTIRAKDTMTVSDVLVGDVWLCGGQSNMEWALSNSTGGAEAMEHSANPLLRLCLVPHNSQMTPQNSARAKWAVSAPGAARSFSAIGYWFGSKLQKELGVPVGVIDNSFGGTTIQAWMPLASLKQGPWPQDKSVDIDLAKAEYDHRVAARQPVMERYETAKAAALRDHQPAPPFPPGSPGDFRGPGVLWNGMVAPFLNYSIRGVAWYQGESNAYVGAANTYKDLLPVMIRDWRQGFQQPALPFIIFQIARYRHPQSDPNEASGIAAVQEAELKTALKTPHTALVVTIDLGEQNVHYANKEPAADRAVKAALAIAYGRDLEYSGPIFKELKIEGDKAVLRFAHVGGGLLAKDGPLQGFVIAGEDRKFVFADARIEGDSIVVTSPQVSQPKAVRYGWAEFPQVNLFSKEGLPASPFRTDDWPLPAAPNKK